VCGIIRVSLVSIFLGQARGLQCLHRQLYVCNPSGEHFIYHPTNHQAQLFSFTLNDFPRQ
jgi:hypothetical protein